MSDRCATDEPIQRSSEHPRSRISAIANKLKSSPPKLKVFRTAIGFHDAYVATPTKKAALEAWGSKKDLFARGAAELVIDTALSEAPLASPGIVIKRLRGTVAEQLAALPFDVVVRTKIPTTGPTSSGAKRDKPTPQRKAKPAPKPKPSRAALDAAERARVELADRQQEELFALAEREANLARERRALVASHVSAAAVLERAEAVERRAYETAIRKWRG